MKKRSKIIWTEKITNLESTWKNDHRHHLLHPHDVIDVNNRFRSFKRSIQVRSHTMKNQAIFLKLWMQIVVRVLKANERMDIVSHILLDMIETE